MTEEELKLLEREKEIKKSKVRVNVTYIAAGYIFGVGTFLGLLCIASIWITALDNEALVVAKDFFLVVLPVATGIITYWFATRPKNTTSKNNDNKE